MYLLRDDQPMGYKETHNITSVPYLSLIFPVPYLSKLKKAFRDSVADYLEFCAKRGEEPEKPFSGKFMIRVEPRLHRELVTRARLRNVSLNAWVHDTLEQAVR